MKKLIALIFSITVLFTGCSAIDKLAELLPGQSSVVERVESFSAESETSEMESEESEESQFENNQPEVETPEGEKPEGNQPEVENPEGEKPEGNQPEVENPEGEKPEGNQPEVENPEGEKPEGNQPEVENPEGENPEGNQPEGEHKYTAVVTPPTCEKEGYTTYTCECGDTYVADKVVMLGHLYESVVTKPTCTTNGYTTYTCLNCKETYIGDETAYLGHKYKSSVTEPTCSSEGYTTYTCDVCGDSYVANEVEAHGHSYKSVVTAPTCTNEGYTTYTCSACGDSYVGNKVSSLGHDYDTTLTAPSCLNMGYTTYVCSTCDDTYISDCIDALGHTWEDATTEAPKTCTTCGTTEGDKLDTSTPSAPVTAPTLYVSYINVGQGDSMLIQVENCDILIDAGTASYGSTVSSYLKSQKVDDLELVINTHPDSDHCGGLTQVFKDYVVEQVWISKDTSKTTAAYKNFTSAIASEGLTAKKPNAGTVYTYGYLTLTVIYSQLVSGDSNNSSIVVMLEYGSFKFLFTGDVGQVAEPSLISSGYDLKCDVLKVGHHGSKYSSTTAFLNKVKPEYGVICVGSNTYGHPTTEALNRLSAADTTVYRTDKNGDVKFSTDGNTLYLPNGSADTTGSGSGLPSNGGSSSSGSTSGGSSSSGATSSGSTSGGTTTSDVFIGNTETKVFHLPTCGNLPAASKQNVMYNYWWIINIAGYTPCGRCLKNYGTGITYVANATSKVYHVSTCSYLPSASNRVYITSTSGYTPCGHCI